jgi:hypothetical protein
MTELDISAVLIELLSALEPDARGATISVDADLGEELGLDDGDLDRFARSVASAFGLVLTARERPLLSSLSGAIAVVRRARAEGAGRSAPTAEQTDGGFVGMDAG